MRSRLLGTRGEGTVRVRGETARRLRRALWRGLWRGLRGIGRLPVLLLRALALLVGRLAVLPGVIRRMPVLARARLRWAVLGWAVLPGAVLGWAVLPGAVLRRAEARVGIGALGVGVLAGVRAMLARAAVAAPAHRLRLRALTRPAARRWLERPAARRSLLPRSLLSRSLLASLGWLAVPVPAGLRARRPGPGGGSVLPVA